MKHLIFALSCLAFLGLASCEKGFDLNSELIPTPGADYKGARVYISSDFSPYNMDKLSIVQAPGAFRDEQLGSKFYVKLDQAVTEDVVVELAIEANERDKALIKGLDSSEADIFPLPAGAIKLSKNSLTIKKGATKSEDFVELMFDKKDEMRRFEGGNFFATIQIVKANQAKTSTNYGKAYVYIKRDEIFMKAHDPKATLSHLKKLDWKTFRLSSGVEAESGSKPEMLFDGNTDTSWDILSVDENTYGRIPNAYYQIDFAQPTKLAGYKIGLSTAESAGFYSRTASMGSYELLLSKDGGNTFRKYHEAVMNTVTSSRKWVEPYHVAEFDGVIDGVTSVRIVPKSNASFFALVTQFAELELYTAQ